MAFVLLPVGVLAGAVGYAYLRPKAGVFLHAEAVHHPRQSFSEYSKGVHFNTEPDGEMKIRTSREGVASLPPVTVIEVLELARSRCGHDAALLTEIAETSQYATVTWSEYYDLIYAVSRAFIDLGLKRHDCVCILGFNSVEWFASLLGAIVAGSKGAGIYATNGPEAIQYILEHSESPVVVVEGVDQLKKVIKIQNSVPKVKAVVVYGADKIPADVLSSVKAFKVLTWKELVAQGKNPATEQKLSEEVTRRQADVRPGHCCSLIYTSGTTGSPKAVMISHDNVTWTSKMIWAELPKSEEAQYESIVSYLPLSHIAAQLFDVFAPLTITSTGKPVRVTFARPTALKGTLGVTLKNAQPTLFFGVPRVWEKMHEKMVEVGSKSGFLKKKIAAWAKSVGAQAYANKQVGGSGAMPSGFALADKIVFKNVRAALGLSKCRLMVTGAAPTSEQTFNFFGSLGIQICEVYGMSESSGPQCLGLPQYQKVGSCGPILPGCELRVDHVPGRDKPGEGELCYRGRHIMMGYMKQPDKSREAIDDEGWLHSGDVGKQDEFGLVRITGRIKELLITAGGENIAPVPVEEALRAALPAISGCMMVGDRRKFNTLLVTLLCELDAAGVPTKRLAGAAAAVNPDVKTPEEAMKDRTWREYIQKGIDHVNKNSVSRASVVQKFEIIPNNFTVEGGELTPTLKLKRSVVGAKYAEYIERMYETE